MPGTSKRPKGYGQYCPLALAAELLCRRWTILVVSRLLDGCTSYSEIRQGVPRISPSLLSRRLQELEHAGIVIRKKVAGSDRHRYELTEAGNELNDTVNQLAVWGQHWARDNDADDLDVEFLAWSMSTRIDTNVTPPGRTVLEFEFTGAQTEFKRFWLVIADGDVDMCIKHPGMDTDLRVQADIRRFVETWRGFRDMRAEIKSGKIQLSGAKRFKDGFPKWLQLSGLAPFKRKNGGREQRLSDGKT